MSALLTLMFVAVIQLALVLHVRNTLTDAASEGARYGALVGNTPTDGAQRTRDLVTATLDARYATAVAGNRQSAVGHDIVVVTVSAPLPIVGLLGPRTLRVTGHAVAEGP